MVTDDPTADRSLPKRRCAIRQLNRTVGGAASESASAVKVRPTAAWVPSTSKKLALTSRAVVCQAWVLVTTLVPTWEKPATEENPVLPFWIAWNASHEKEPLD